MSPGDAPERLAGSPGGWLCLRGRETMRGTGEEHADAWLGHRHHVQGWGPWLVSDDRPLRHKADQGGRREGVGGARRGFRPEASDLASCLTSPATRGQPGARSFCGELGCPSAPAWGRGPGANVPGPSLWLPPRMWPRADGSPQNLFPKEPFRFSATCGVFIEAIFRQCDSAAPFGARSIF